jgi:hypothetical protein
MCRVLHAAGKVVTVEGEVDAYELAERDDEGHLDHNEEQLIERHVREPEEAIDGSRHAQLADRGCCRAGGRHLVPWALLTVPFLALDDYTCCALDLGHGSRTASGRHW